MVGPLADRRLVARGERIALGRQATRTEEDTEARLIVVATRAVDNLVHALLKRDREDGELRLLMPPMSMTLCQAS